MKYLIWSNQQRMWWRPASRGYTSIVDEAGRYELDEAVAIVADSTVYGRLTHRRTDPYTGEEYSCLDEVMLAAPESTPKTGATATVARLRQLAEKWVATPAYIPLAQVGRDLLEILDGESGGGR